MMGLFALGLLVFVTLTGSLTLPWAILIGCMFIGQTILTVGGQ